MEEAAHGAPKSAEEISLIHIPGVPEPVIWGSVAALIMLVLAAWAVRSGGIRPNAFGTMFEEVYDWLMDLAKSLLGSHVDQFFWLISALFLFIWTCNMIKLIPGFHAATSNLNTTIAMALIVFTLTHIMGIKSMGPIGYAKHLAGDIWWLAPFMFVLHIISELVRPISLSFRLFGNIMGEGKVLAVLIMLGGMIVGAYGKMHLEIFIGISLFALGIYLVFLRKAAMPKRVKLILDFVLIGLAVCALFPILLPIPILFLAILLGTLQALVFAVLSAIYIAGAMESHH